MPIILNISPIPGIPAPPTPPSPPSPPIPFPIDDIIPKYINRDIKISNDLSVKKAYAAFLPYPSDLLLVLASWPSSFPACHRRSASAAAFAVTFRAALIAITKSDIPLPCANGDLTHLHGLYLCWRRHPIGATPLTSGSCLHFLHRL